MAFIEGCPHVRGGFYEEFHLFILVGKFARKYVRVKLLLYLIILYPDDDDRCMATTPWVTSHSTGLATN